ncbi:hypothetical protein WGM54_14905 [Paenibacillus polymyxa]|uniref:hypothetical protein n=1 Tax=Paenibacillus polymyxa TaxID=1406 RepID=UPI00307DF231
MEIAAKARLRPKKDDDLIKVWNNLPPHKDKSDIVREALRLFFFGVHPTPNNIIQASEKYVALEEEKEFEVEKIEQVINEQDYEERFDELLNSFE